MRWRGWGFEIAVALSVLAGCAIRTPADLGRGLRGGPFTVEIDWPAEPDPAPIELITGADRAEIIRLPHDGPGELMTVRLRETTPPSSRGDPIRVEVGSGHDAFLTLSFTPTDASIAPDRGSEESLYFFASATSYAHPALVDGVRQVKTTLQADPTILMLIDPLVEPRGVMLMLSSLSGFTPGEVKLVDVMIERGWLVVWCSPSLVHLSRPISPVTAETALDDVAAELGKRINANVAHRAHAMGAMLDYLHDSRPGLVDLPTVAVGCSAGAIYLPTMVARMPQQVDAAVLIGGGADLYEIATRSSLLKGTLRVDMWGREPTAIESEQIHGKVLAQAVLDPFHTAPRLANVPVLMLHALFDAIVPAHTGDLLYERLDRPERWAYALGHVGLFVWLQAEATAIADWIERAVDAK